MGGGSAFCRRLSVQTRVSVGARLPGCPNAKRDRFMRCQGLRTYVKIAHFSVWVVQKRNQNANRFLSVAAVVKSVDGPGCATADQGRDRHELNER